MADNEVTARLAYLRGEIEAERISYGEIEELQNLGTQGLIPEDDVLLREWAGLPETNTEIDQRMEKLINERWAPSDVTTEDQEKGL